MYCYTFSTYTQLHVFGCLCYPNISSSSPHNLFACYFPCLLRLPLFLKRLLSPLSLLWKMRHLLSCYLTKLNFSSPHQSITINSNHDDSFLLHLPSMQPSIPPPAPGSVPWPTPTSPICPSKHPCLHHAPACLSLRTNPAHHPLANPLDLLLPSLLLPQIGATPFLTMILYPCTPCWLALRPYI